MAVSRDAPVRRMAWGWRLEGKRLQAANGRTREVVAESQLLRQLDVAVRERGGIVLGALLPEDDAGGQLEVFDGPAQPTTLSASWRISVLIDTQRAESASVSPGRLPVILHRRGMLYTSRGRRRTRCIVHHLPSHRAHGGLNGLETAKRVCTCQSDA